MWAIFQIVGKCPISNKLLKSLDIENDIGVEMKLKNFPEIPQWDWNDFFIFLINFPISIGLVLTEPNNEIFSKGSSCGAESL